MELLCMLISTNTGLRSARIGKPRIKMPEAIQSLAKAGFEAVDVNFYCTTVQEPLEHEPVLDGDWKSNLHELMEQIRGNNLKISSSHTAFHKYLDKNDPEYEWYNKARILSIEASAYIRAGWAVIHPFTDENGTDTKRTIEELKPCAEAAAKWGVGLAVENMFSTDAAQLCEIADALDIGVCWDTGHANIKKLDQAAEIRMLGDRLKDHTVRPGHTDNGVSISIPLCAPCVPDRIRQKRLYFRDIPVCLHSVVPAKNCVREVYRLPGRTSVNTLYIHVFALLISCPVNINPG
jgi:sugar phosphate isomerase/epimerase